MPCCTPDPLSLHVQCHLHRLEKQQLTENVQGQLTRANARLRNLQAQHERLELRENERSTQAMAAARPKTCPIIPSVAGGAPRGGHVERLRMASDAGRALSGGGAEGERAVNETRRAMGKPFVRVVWGAGRSRD